MNKSNFSLISALYSTKSAGLYNDVYFPIIKYAVVTLYYDKSESKKEYFSPEDIHIRIKEVFGIEIPTIVLKKVIQRLNNTDDTSLQLYENGEKFRILKAWDISINQNIDERTRYFESNMASLEALYQTYKEEENVSDNIKFVDFISDNSDDILGFFENEDIDKIDERYSTLAYFLQKLHTTNPDLFKIANELFWGSVIAGFLKRENPENLYDENNRVEYFLDTSLVMALLKLSTPEHETYAEEMLDIMKASGGIPRVHPMTLKEVTNILLSVESNCGPRPNTEIESAYERYHLNPAKLAGIRAKLQRLVEEKDVSVFPNASLYDINQLINSYRNKKTVADLRKTRGVSDEIFRDIHDVFMNDYIEERRIGKSTEDCFFVTLNTDLISFCKKRTSHSISNLIHPGKVVVELWMHNTKSSTSTIKNKALTEAIARCLTINDRDVRRKLEVVSRYYNSSSSDFDAETYKAIILGLFKKARNIISYVDEVISNDRDKQFNENAEVIRKLKAEADIYRKSNDEKLTSFQGKVKELEQKLENHSKQVQELTQNKSGLTADLAESQRREQDLKEENSKQAAELGRQKEDNEKKDKLIALLNQKEQIASELRALQDELKPLESERDKSVSYLFYWGAYWGLVFTFLALIISFINIFKEVFGLKIPMVISGISTLACATIILTIWKNEPNIFMPKVFKADVRHKQLKVWDEKHPRYSKILHEIDSLEAKKDELENEITTNK